jgi:hypothetical protein
VSAALAAKRADGWRGKKPKGARASWPIRAEAFDRTRAALGAIPAEAVKPWDGQLAFSLWQGRRAKRATKAREQESFAGLVARLGRYSSQVIPKAQGYSIAAVSKDGRRLDASFAETWLLALDCDGAGDWHAIRDVLVASGVSFILQRSTSHTPEKPKWHLLLPLVAPARPATKEAWYAQYGHAIGVLESLAGLPGPGVGGPSGTGFDPAIELRMALSFVPTRRDAATPAPEIVAADTGRALDLDAFLAATGFDAAAHERARQAEALALAARRAELDAAAKARAESRKRALEAGIVVPGGAWPAAYVTSAVERRLELVRAAAVGDRNGALYRSAFWLGGLDGGGAFENTPHHPSRVREDLIASSFAAGGHDLAHVREVAERAWSAGRLVPVQPPAPRADGFTAVSPDVEHARQRVCVREPEWDQLDVSRVWITDAPQDAQAVANALERRVIALTDPHDAHAEASKICAAYPGAEVVVAFDADPRADARARASRVALMERLALRDGFDVTVAEWPRALTFAAFLAAGGKPSLRAVLRPAAPPPAEASKIGEPAYHVPKALPEGSREVFLRAAPLTDVAGRQAALRRASVCAVGISRQVCSSCGRRGCECVLVCELSCCPHCSRERARLTQDWLAANWPEKVFVARLPLADDSPDAARARRTAAQRSLKKLAGRVRFVLGPDAVVVVGMRDDATVLAAALGTGGLLGRRAAAEAAVAPIFARATRLLGHVQRGDANSLAQDPWVAGVVSTSCGASVREKISWAPNEDIRAAAGDEAEERRAEGREASSGGGSAPDVSPCCRVAWAHVLLVEGREVARRETPWTHIEAAAILLEDWARQQRQVVPKRDAG